MRIFVTFENDTHVVDVDTGRTVGEIKTLLQEKLGLSLNNNRTENEREMSLVYQGSSLHDEWIYSDLGIAPGTILVCRIEKRIVPTLRVFCSRCEETIRFKNSFAVSETFVSTIRTMIQDSTGIHVSAFRLYSANGVELFDCHPLRVYDIGNGDTITMEIWRDVEELVKAARTDDITDTVQALESFHEAPILMRYQLQLGLFIAAHFGYHQLASQLIKCGARPNEPVGPHPSREWCRTDSHADNVKTPSHEAAQHGQITCLQHFLMFNRAVLICTDANGFTPCNIARRFQQVDCFKLLVAEQFRVPTGNELSIHVYSRVRKWCDRARMRARVHKDKTALLLLSNGAVARANACVGQKINVDGFSASGANQQEDSKTSCVNSHKKTRHQDILLQSRGYSSSSSRSNGTSDLQSRSRDNSNIERKKGSTSNPTQLRVKERNSLKGTSHGQLNTQHAKQISEVIKSDYNVRQISREKTGNAEKLSALSARETRGISTSSGPGSAENSRRNSTPARKHDPPTAEKGGLGRYVWKPLNEEYGKIDNSVVEVVEPLVISQTSKGFRSPCSATAQRIPIKNNKKGMSSRNLVDSDKTCATKRNNIKWSTSSGTGSTNNEECNSPHSSVSSRNEQAQRRYSADKCLQVATETFPRKTWMGQVQMALVVNTNMFKRRPWDVL